MFCFHTSGCPEQKHPGVTAPYTRMLKGARWGCLATKVPCQTMKTAWFGKKQNSFLI